MTTLNVPNRTLYHGDNLDFMRALNSNSVHLIATDPPFNKGRDFHATPGSLATGAKFEDRWSWDDDVHPEWKEQIQDDWPALWFVIEAAETAHSEGMAAFLCWLAVRVLEMHRVLRDDGSLYLHCDPTASHYIKAMLDSVFEKKNFRNEIMWCYTGNSVPTGGFQKKHDVILFYAKSEAAKFAMPLAPYSEATIRRYNHVDEDGRRYKMSSLRSGLERVYMKEGKPMEDWWADIPVVRKKSELTGYPTQKPVALYDRMIQASSNKGDIAFDPFCGCATTLVAAEKAGRQWIGCDIWDKAHEQVLVRLYREGLNPDSPEAKMSLKELAKALGIQQNSADLSKLGTDRATADRYERDGATRERLKSQQLDMLTREHHVNLTSVLPVRDDDGAVAAPYLELKKQSKKIRPGAEDESAKWPNEKKKSYLISATAKVLKNHGNVCWGCGEQFRHPSYLELDHINPRVGGGANSLYNRALLCGPCNKRKGPRITLYELRNQNRRDGFMVAETEAPAIPINPTFPHPSPP